VVAVVVAVLVSWPVAARGEPAPEPETDEEPGYISAPPESRERGRRARRRPEAPKKPEAPRAPGRVRRLTQGGSATAILGGLSFGIAASLTALDDRRRLDCYERRNSYPNDTFVECDPDMTEPRLVSRGLYLASVGLLAGSGSLWGERAAAGRMAYGWPPPDEVVLLSAGGTLLGMGIVGWGISRLVMFASPVRNACATDGFEECTRRNMFASDISRGASVAMAGAGAAMLAYVISYRSWMRRASPKPRSASVGLTLGRGSLGMVATGRF
jgi:hypothetical protein